MRYQIFMSFLGAFAHLRMCRTKREIKDHDNNSGASELSTRELFRRVRFASLLSSPIRVENLAK